MTSNELAWMAGIVDGEGTITIAKQIRKDRPSTTYRAIVSISNCDLRILNPFKDYLGGTIFTIKRNEQGYSDCSIWHCPTSKIYNFLNEILPYIKGKKEQAFLILKFIEQITTYKRYKGSTEGKRQGGSHPLSENELIIRDLLWKKSHELNKKGKFKV